MSPLGQIPVVAIAADLGNLAGPARTQVETALEAARRSLPPAR